ncbi:LytTR family DNA-binding domain-containing protein [Puniceicoccaceae bacterium K14]|nr:LytTR family DNA-binding domain-containing protein [Puniceicoccaceae bacterium K14]
MTTALKPIHALIVDDEELAQLQIKYLLRNFPRFDKVETASSLDEALSKYNTSKPDVIFLDINIQEKTGFELLESLEDAPPIIFSTAHEEHALKAFQVQAFDYILKPIDSARLNKILQRFIKEFDKTAHQPIEEDEGNPFNRIFLKDGDNAWFIGYDEIQRIESEGSFCRIYHNSKETKIHRSLVQIEAKLPSKHFFRANRQTLINLAWLQDINVWFDGKFLLKMKDGSEIQLSRSAAKSLREITSL